MFAFAETRQLGRADAPRQRPCRQNANHPRRPRRTAADFVKAVDLQPRTDGVAAVGRRKAERNRNLQPDL